MYTYTYFRRGSGYFRFIVPLALIAARALLFQDLRVTGPRAPAFNLSGACAIPALLLLELLEDRVVLHEPGILLRSATFKKEARIFVAIGPSSGILQEPGKRETMTPEPIGGTKTQTMVMIGTGARSGAARATRAGVQTGPPISNRAKAPKAPAGIKVKAKTPVKKAPSRTPP